MRTPDEGDDLFGGGDGAGPDGDGGKYSFGRGVGWAGVLRGGKDLEAGYFLGGGLLEGVGEGTV